MEASLRALTIKRGTVKARITRFSSYLESINNDSELVQLKARLKKAEESLEEFENIQGQIEELEPQNLEEHSAERGNFEDVYFSAIARAQSHILRMTPASYGATNSGTINGQSEDAPQVKLPTINLPVFNGDYDQWLTFVDTFTSLIHNNNNISDIQKFHYLRSALTHEAAQVIHSLEISSINYQVAWDLLRERFQNKRVIVQNHIKALFEQPQVVKDSYTSVRSLLDTISRHLRALKSLGQPIETWDSLLIHIITSKFDILTKREWETTVNSKELPSMEQLNKFLQQRCHLLQSLEESVVGCKSKHPVVQAKPRHAHRGSSRHQEQSHNFVASTKNPCPKCKQDHLIYNCDAFTKQSVQDRFKDIKKFGLCLNCLRGGHQVSQCHNGVCRICGKKHNTLLHFDSIGEVTTLEHSSTMTHHVTLARDSHVVLSTVVIIVYDQNGHSHSCRALLDSGSQSNFISLSFAKRLGLPLQDTFIPIAGVNQTVTPSRQGTTATIQSRLNNYRASLFFLILRTITDRLPSLTLNRQSMNLPSHLKLADPDFHRPAPIDMLLGAEIFWDILCAGQLRPNSKHPVLQKTQFGWVVSGRMLGSREPPTPRLNCHFSRNDDLHCQVERFWVQEETPTLKRYSIEEQACESHFQTNTKRDQSGRFIVKLPLKADPSSLGKSKPSALVRFQHLERKLARNPELKDDYVANLQDYIDKGHMKRIPTENSPPCQSTVFFIYLTTQW